MSLIPKAIFEKRVINAAKRMLENKEKGRSVGLNERQADALAGLARARHDFHSNMNAVIKGDDSGDRIKKSLLDAIVEIDNAGLPSVKGVPYEMITDNNGYIDIDGISDLYEYLGKEGVDWNFDDEWRRIADEVGAANVEIEKYLRDIDSKYGTKYAPTGKFRF